MERLTETRSWLEAHQDLGYAFVRMYLGIALFVRGLMLLAGSAAVSELAVQQDAAWIFPYVAIAHLAGGLMLAAGLLTRLAALVQIPVLVGAVFLIHIEEGLLAPSQSLELSTLVLFLLVVFFLFGSGPLSVDSRVQRLEAIQQRWMPRALRDRKDLPYALMRFYVGAALFIRGCIMIGNSPAFVALASEYNIGWLYNVTLVHYIVIAHLAGGLMLALGMLSRLAALVQIPVLVGAVFLIHIEEGLLAPGQSLELAALVLFLLVVFFLFGSGAYSIDTYAIHEEAKVHDTETERAARAPRYAAPERVLSPASAGSYQMAYSSAEAMAPGIATAPAFPAERRVSIEVSPPSALTSGRVGMGAYLLSFGIALPFFLIRAIILLLEPSSSGRFGLIPIADLVLTYLVLPFFLALTVIWLVSRVSARFR